MYNIFEKVNFFTISLIVASNSALAFRTASFLPIIVIISLS